MTVNAQPLTINHPSVSRHGTAVPWRDLFALAPQAGLMSEAWIDHLLDRIEARP